jgi:hypothetical protein
MSYVPGFHNDIYISYAHRDDEPVSPGQVGWTESLRRVLEVRLAQLLGKSVAVARDPKLALNAQDPQTLEYQRDAAILICVVSPAYVNNEWCRREVRAFLDQANRTLPTATKAPARVFKVVVSPIPDSEQPESLSGLPGYEFYAEDPATGQVRQLNDAFRDDLEFWQRVDRLAHDIADRLRSIKSSTSAGEHPQRNQEVLSPPHPLDVIEANKQLRRLRVFLCHSSEDKSQVRSLYQFLVSAGVDAWLDEEKLLPGQLWEQEIPKAVRASDAIVVCLSRNSINKRGYIQKEIREALGVADEHPEGALFLIPAKLEECDIPERLAQRQWVNLFQEHGNALLLNALQARATQLSVELGGNG